jgi:hypothetical protein
MRRLMGQSKQYAATGVRQWSGIEDKPTGKICDRVLNANGSIRQHSEGGSALWRE